MVRNFKYLKEKLDSETDHTLKKGLYTSKIIDLFIVEIQENGILLSLQSDKGQRFAHMKHMHTLLKSKGLLKNLSCACYLYPRAAVFKWSVLVCSSLPRGPVLDHHHRTSAHV